MRRYKYLHYIFSEILSTFYLTARKQWLPQNCHLVAGSVVIRNSTSFDQISRVVTRLEFQGNGSQDVLEICGHEFSFVGLQGVALISPVINYWWSSFPTNVSWEAYKLQPLQDQWAVAVSHYVPWLVYWWNTQKWFPGSSVIAGRANLSSLDREVLTKSHRQRSPTPMPSVKDYVRQQGLAESIFRDMRVGFGKWEFDPMELENPFPNNEGSVHLWHGDEDWIVPVSLQRYIAKKLPWIHHHELPGVGHALPKFDGNKEAILKSLLLKEN